jgi:hypothetical protein
VGRCTILEGIDVILNGRDRDLVCGGSLCKELGVVNTLSSRSDLLTTHEEVVRVCVIRVARVNHGVEGTSIDWVSVKHVEVGLELFADELAKDLLVLGVEILKRVLGIAVLSKKLYTLFEAESDILAEEGLERILIADDLEFLSKSLVKTLENVNKHLCEEIKDFKVVLFEGHLDIKASELAQVAVGV